MGVDARAAVVALTAGGAALPGSYPAASGEAVQPILPVVGQFEFRVSIDPFCLSYPSPGRLSAARANRGRIPMQTPHEMRTRIIDKAASDPDYRARLLDDPRATVAAELGVTIPNALTIKVHEEDAGSAHLVLPPSSRLHDTDLGAVAGGVFDWSAWRSNSAQMERSGLDW